MSADLHAVTLVLHDDDDESLVSCNNGSKHRCRTSGQQVREQLVAAVGRRRQLLPTAVVRAEAPLLPAHRRRRRRGGRGGGGRRRLRRRRRRVARELVGEHLHHLPHGGALHAVVLHAEHGDEEEVRHLVGRRPAADDEAAVQDPRHGLPSSRRDPLRPLHDVDAFPEVRAHGAPPRDELQQHHPVAVHVALLVHPQRVRVL